MRRAKTLYPTSLLIDQDRGVRSTNAISQFLNEQSYLLRRFDVPLEQDKAPRPLGADEITFRDSQFGCRYASDKCAGLHWRRLAFVRPRGQPGWENDG